MLLIAALESLGRAQEAAAIRAEAPESAEKAIPPNLQDGNALARLVRVSRNLDRELPRTAGEAAAGQPAPADSQRKPRNNVVRP